MKLLAIIFALFIQFEINNKPHIDYKAPSYYSMLDNADLIIRSEIVNQSDTTISLKINEILKGKVSEEIIELMKFRDWPCASRHHAYQVGQNQINILRVSDDGAFHRMSGGNEGELPIDGEFMYIKSWFNRGSQYKVQFGRVSGFKFDLDESIKGLKRLIKYTETISSTQKDCNLIEIESMAGIESMIIEEQVMTKKLKYECENFENYRFEVINQQMYSY